LFCGPSLDEGGLPQRFRITLVVRIRWRETLEQ